MLPNVVRRSGARWGLLAAAAVALLLLGLYDEQARALLTQVAERVTGGGGGGLRPAGEGAPLTTRNVPAMVAFGLLYVGLSVLVLHMALANRRQTWLVMLSYGGALGVVAALLIVGKLLGMGATFTPLAREVIDFILSPLPVVLLLAVFWLAPRE